MKGKVLVAGLSLILVVGVIVGVVVGVNRHKANEASKTSASMKAVKSICEPTEFKDLCMQSLKGAAENSSATPKDLIQAAVKVTIEEMKKALDGAKNMNSSAPKENASSDELRDGIAAENCEELIELAIDELNAAFSQVGEATLQSLPDRVSEFNNWLSATIAYQQTCIDGFTQPHNQKMINSTLLNATELTSNALTIISKISNIVKDLTGLNMDIPGLTDNNSNNNNNNNKTSSGRRLLEHTGVTSDGYPTWLSAADRRLLAAGGRHGGGRNGRKQIPNGAGPGVTPNVVVAKDGSGQFKTISDGLKAYPKGNKGRWVVYVKAGVYEETVMVDKNMVNVFMYGDGPRQTIVTGSKNFKAGTPTYATATFSVVGNGFIAKSMGFSNTAGPDGHQAVALRVQSDASAFYNCRMDGHQDTLYAQAHRQFYRNCVISGTVDFIFGDAASLIQNSLIIVRMPNPNQQNIVTAQGRLRSDEMTGIVIQNCRIVPEEKLFPQRFQIRSYLGRPWKMYSRTIIMETEIGDLIHPDGWMPWDKNFALDTLEYAEFANTGPGANTNRRIKWKGYHIITNRNDVQRYTATPFLQGDSWLKNTGAPYDLGFTKS